MFFNNPSYLVAVSGVSGTGKTTLIANLEQKFPGSRVTTYTTRPKRPSESNLDYHFSTIEQIHALPDTLWIRENYGHLYAVTKSSFLLPLHNCGVALLPTITSHHRKLKGLFKDVKYVGIHLLAPPQTELRHRMLARGGSSKDITARLQHIEQIDHKAIMDVSLLKISPNTPEVVLKTVLTHINHPQINLKVPDS